MTKKKKEKKKKAYDDRHYTYYTMEREVPKFSPLVLLVR
jgi:hypothetical protein